MNIEQILQKQTEKATRILTDAGIVGSVSVEARMWYRRYQDNTMANGCSRVTWLVFGIRDDASAFLGRGDSVEEAIADLISNMEAEDAKA